MLCACVHCRRYIIYYKNANKACPMSWKADQNIIYKHLQQILYQVGGAKLHAQWEDVY